MSSWKGLGRIADDFAALDVAVLGVAADTPARLNEFRAKLGVPFTFLSDPELATATALDAPIASRKNLAATALLHPVVLTYPRRSFLQPALFVWRRDGALAHRWCQTESSLTNRFGAKGRPRAEQVLQIVRDVLAR